MAQFRMNATKPFYLDGHRYESGDIIEADALCVVRDLIWRGIVVAAPLAINPSSVESVQR